MRAYFSCVLISCVYIQNFQTAASSNQRNSAKFTSAEEYNRNRIRAIPSQQSQLIAADSPRRNPHNLYRITGAVCRIIRHNLCNIGNILLRKKPEEKVVERSLDSENSNDNGSALSRAFGSFLKKLPERNRLETSSPISFLNVFSKLLPEKNQTNQRNVNSFFRRLPSRSSSNAAVFVPPKSWGGLAVTEKEKVSLLVLHKQRLAAQNNNGDSTWLQNATPTDLLRFLRTRGGDPTAAWKMISGHSKWRTSRHGADTILKNHLFDKSILHRELFWLGVSADGHPTLVIRTQAHDGTDYCDDPVVFTSFFVLLLEEGIQKYGVGKSHQVRVILDRGNYVRKGVKKEYKTDMSVVPNLVNLFKHLYGTISDNYPDLLFEAQVVPASWFFSICYAITSRVMDSSSRGKFIMVKSDDVAAAMTRLFSSQVLPPHLGGLNTEYGEAIKESEGFRSGGRDSAVRSLWGNTLKVFKFGAQHNP